MVQFLYNFLVVAHRLYMNNTHFIELDVLTPKIMSPRSGLFYKNSKNETIKIGLKMLVMSGVIERPGTFVSFYGVEKMIEEKGKFTGKMLWQHATNVVFNSGYEKAHTQKTQVSPVPTIIVSNIAAVTPEKRKRTMTTNVSMVPAVHSKKTEDDDIVSVFPFHYNTRNHLPQRNYAEIDMYDNISEITNNLDGDASWNSSSFTLNGN